MWGRWWGQGRRAGRARSEACCVAVDRAVTCGRLAFAGRDCRVPVRSLDSRSVCSLYRACARLHPRCRAHLVREAAGGGTSKRSDLLLLPIGACAALLARRALRPCLARQRAPPPRRHQRRIRHHGDHRFRCDSGARSAAGPLPAWHANIHTDLARRHRLRGPLSGRQVRHGRTARRPARPARGGGGARGAASLAGGR